MANHKKKNHNTQLEQPLQKVWPYVPKILDFLKVLGFDAVYNEERNQIALRDSLFGIAIIDNTTQKQVRWEDTRYLPLKYIETGLEYLSYPNEARKQYFNKKYIYNIYFLTAKTIFFPKKTLISRKTEYIREKHILPIDIDVWHSKINQFLFPPEVIKSKVSIFEETKPVAITFTGGGLALFYRYERPIVGGSNDYEKNKYLYRYQPLTFPYTPKLVPVGFATKTAKKGYQYFLKEKHAIVSEIVQELLYTEVYTKEERKKILSKSFTLLILLPYLYQQLNVFVQRLKEYNGVGQPPLLPESVASIIEHILTKKPFSINGITIYPEHLIDFLPCDARLMEQISELEQAAIDEALEEYDTIFKPIYEQIPNIDIKAADTVWYAILVINNVSKMLSTLGHFELEYIAHLATQLKWQIDLIGHKYLEQFPLTYLMGLINQLSTWQAYMATYELYSKITSLTDMAISEELSNVSIWKQLLKKIQKIYNDNEDIDEETLFELVNLLHKQQKDIAKLKIAGTNIFNLFKNSIKFQLLSYIVSFMPFLKREVDTYFKSSNIDINSLYIQVRPELFSVVLTEQAAMFDDRTTSQMQLLLKPSFFVGGKFRNVWIEYISKNGNKLYPLAIEHLTKNKKLTIKWIQYLSYLKGSILPMFINNFAITFQTMYIDRLFKIVDKKTNDMTRVMRLPYTANIKRDMLSAVLFLDENNIQPDVKTHIEETMVPILKHIINTAPFLVKHRWQRTIPFKDENTNTMEIENENYHDIHTPQTDDKLNPDDFDDFYQYVPSMPTSGMSIRDLLNRVQKHDETPDSTFRNKKKLADELEKFLGIIYNDPQYKDVRDVLLHYLHYKTEEFVSKIGPYYQKGVRHYLHLFLAGSLRRKGIPYSIAKYMLMQLAKHYEDEELEDRKRAIKDAYKTDIPATPKNLEMVMKKYIDMGTMKEDDVQTLIRIINAFDMKLLKLMAFVFTLHDKLIYDVLVSKEIIIYGDVVRKFLEKNNVLKKHRVYGKTLCVWRNTNVIHDIDLVIHPKKQYTVYVVNRSMLSSWYKFLFKPYVKISISLQGVIRYLERIFDSIAGYRNYYQSGFASLLYAMEKLREWRSSFYNGEEERRETVALLRSNYHTNLAYMTSSTSKKRTTTRQGVPPPG